jgi:hypothetical protein
MNENSVGDVRGFGAPAFCTAKDEILSPGFKFMFKPLN